MSDKQCQYYISYYKCEKSSYLTFNSKCCHLHFTFFNMFYQFSINIDNLTFAYEESETGSF